MTPLAKDWTKDFDPPAPASLKAIANGCTCPVKANEGGSPSVGETVGFTFADGCPVHDRGDAE